jgi:hypothetical protein
MRGPPLTPPKEGKDCGDVILAKLAGISCWNRVGFLLWRDDKNTNKNTVKIYKKQKPIKRNHLQKTRPKSQNAI